MNKSPLFIFLLFLLYGCSAPSDDMSAALDSGIIPCNHPAKVTGAGNVENPPTTGALLASRFNSLEELKSVVQIEYFNSGGKSMVRLRHCSNGQEVVSELTSGVSQGDIVAARDGDIWERLTLLFAAPDAIASRMDLAEVYTLARRRGDLFGADDLAFFLVAEKSVKNINTPGIAYKNPRDKGEKGYLNSFNHIFAQAFITSCYSEALADFVADVHERQSMPELTTGIFSEDQLTDPVSNPVDHYVDLINNEWGQEIGKALKEKYQIDRNTRWTPTFLANYMNDLQSYFCGAFQIGMKPFRPDDEAIKIFSRKIMLVMAGATLLK